MVKTDNKKHLLRGTDNNGSLNMKHIVRVLAYMYLNITILHYVF